jgi:hypothetical protein
MRKQIYLDVVTVLHFISSRICADFHGFFSLLQYLTRSYPIKIEMVYHSGDLGDDPGKQAPRWLHANLILIAPSIDLS